MKGLLALPTACWLILGFGLPAWASEKTIRLEDAPPAVQKTVQGISQGATLRGLTMEREEGKTTYEAELEVNGHGRDVSMDDSGAVLEVEEEVTLDSLPAGARSAVEKAAAAGKILKLESITRGDAVVAYEAQIKKGVKKSEIRVKPDGSPALED